MSSEDVLVQPGATPARAIGPWGDLAADLPVLGRPLSEWRKEALTLPAGVHGRLTASEDLWVTPALAQAFARAAAAGGKPVALALKAGLQTDFAGAMQEVDRRGDLWVYPLSWSPRPPGSSDTLPGGHEPLVIDDEAKPLELPIHKALVPGGNLTLPLTGRGVVRVTHWIHVLRANQLALLAHGHDLMHTRPLRLLAAAMRARSIDQHKVMARLTQRIRKPTAPDVHPTAVVEASVLGPGSRVGAHAVVRHSYLAANAIVGDQASVVSSVLGEGASVGRMGMLQSCVLMKGANTGHFGHQLCVIGRDTFIGGEVILADFTPAETSHVQDQEGALHPAETPLLGCAVGHNVRLMAGLYVAPGRAIPNGVTIIGPQRDVLRRLPSPHALGAAPPETVWAPDGQGGLSQIGGVPVAED